MSTKDRVIQALEKAKGEYISGEKLAGDLAVSRNAVWKAVNDLKKQGYAIDSVKNRGYMLSESSDIISKSGVELCLRDMKMKTQAKPILDNLSVYDNIDSTNTQAKREIVFDGFDVPHKTTIVARVQSNGKGHSGKNFESPNGGIYLSMILTPSDLVVTEPVNQVVTKMVIDVILDKCGILLDRKENNSLYAGDEKVVGILTEALSDLETGVYSRFIVGIGIRTDILGKKAGDMPSKNQILAALIARFSEL